MTDRPFVSIVTPTLNQGRFIEATINSIRAQTYDHFEHIVVDGGSTDGTLDILRRHEGAYNMRWLSEPDNGMYDAINKGMRLTSGEILAYLNSDDLYFPWTLETVVEAFIRHPKADFLFGDALSIRDDTGEHLVYWSPPFRLDLLRHAGFLAQPTVFWRRRAQEVIGPFDDGLRFVADCDYWMRAGEMFRFEKVHEFLAIERLHTATLRESTDSRVWAELGRVRARYIPTSGRAHQRAIRRQHVWVRLWSRMYWVWVLFQLLLPRSVRFGPWSRFLRSSAGCFAASKVLMLQIPWIGERNVRSVIPPNRYWLEQ